MRAAENTLDTYIVKATLVRTKKLPTTARR